MERGSHSVQHGVCSTSVVLSQLTRVRDSGGECSAADVEGSSVAAQTTALLARD